MMCLCYATRMARRCIDLSSTIADCTRQAAARLYVYARACVISENARLACLSVVHLVNLIHHHHHENSLCVPKRSWWWWLNNCMNLEQSLLPTLMLVSREFARGLIGNEHRREYGGQGLRYVTLRYATFRNTRGLTSHTWTRAEKYLKSIRPTSYRYQNIRRTGWTWKWIVE